MKEEKKWKYDFYSQRNSVFEKQEEIIHTGGEGLGLMIGAGILGVLAIGGMIYFFVSGKK